MTHILAITTHSLLMLFAGRFTSVLAAKAIADCPTLRKRAEPVTNVAELQIQDVDVFAGLGDSMMAGFAAQNINYDSPERYTPVVMLEHRGQSSIMGGDANASTLATIVKRYNPELVGPSVGSHMASFCNEAECKSPTNSWVPWKDNLNAAQTGAVAKNLDRELDYLVPRMKNLLKNRFESSWKIVNIQIGSNGQCDVCNEKAVLDVTPKTYRESVITAIERIRNEIPRVLINLIGIFKVSNILDVRARQHDYCKSNLLTLLMKECDCLQVEGGAQKMDEQFEAYTRELQAIANKYASLRNETFAIMYNPLPIDIRSFPVDAISNIDCFHPNLKANDWLSKALWNQMYRSKDNKVTEMLFQEDMQVYCPTEDDRFSL